MIKYFKLTLLISAMVLAVSPVLGQNRESLEMIEKLRNLQFDQLGNPQIKSDAIPPVLASADSPHRMLIIPVQYSDRRFDRYSGRGSDRRNSDYFQELLFSDNFSSPAEETLTHYYYHQSKGRYFVTGEVLPVVTVDNPSEFYGVPIQNSDGAWRNDVRPEILVEDALLAAVEQNPDFAWENFDVWDPQDYDGDNNYAESDGYIDHFVLIFAGKGQASCQGLFNLNQKFTANAPSDIYDALEAVEQECAQRIWPHRFALTKNNGRGPEVEGSTNRRGGIELKEGLWVYDYNMQSEYTNVSTFIHEFGHSIGLPDIYAAQTNNSTASWEAMSATASPVPQELSSWSRLMLGWMQPCIINPRSASGAPVQSVYLKTMNDWQQDSSTQAGLCDSAMVILPPKIRELRMGEMQRINGEQAAYTGQGNDLNHYLSRSFDLADVTADEIVLEFDAWFRIEAGWDYLYIEASTDGENYRRLLPVDKDDPADTSSIMPSRRGHDGLGTIPGFTGRSGDRDGDGRVESAAGCDVNLARALAEDRIGETAIDPCEIPDWVHAEFDLADYRGQTVEIRFHYFADMAAAEDGALVDNIEIRALGYRDDFESSEFQGWSVEGFSLSAGSHDIAVPHFYLLEYRDPYERFASAYNYDNSLEEPGFIFYRDPESGQMEAVDFRYRSGVLMWYYNGSYLWSQNEPAQFGPGNGFLLLVDSTPQEYELPPVPAAYFKEDDGWRFYQFNDDAQATLRQGFLDVMCFQRRRDYYPIDVSDADKATCGHVDVPGESIGWNGKQLIYGYTLSNEFLPGADRDPYKSMSTLYNYRIGRDGVSFRLYDRILRNAHSADAPFALEDFDNGIQFYQIQSGELVQAEGQDFEAVSSFSDAGDFLNPHLQFGSANIPNAGLNFQLAEPDDTAPDEAKVKVYFSWDR
ncbi:MAG: immune inhibitor A [Gammaproteobacteria bacterium]|jgi:M6 family metalloprotease-like protein|nr:immune inhibitor A [Gammaproteobacteria bacterium]MDP6731583.1 immune inhibitor A [Gammaproteobacteria bacterium]